MCPLLGVGIVTLFHLPARMRWRPRRPRICRHVEGADGHGEQRETANPGTENCMRSKQLWSPDEYETTMGNRPRVVYIRYWTDDDIRRLVKLAEAQATTKQIALELDRSALAVRLKASRMGLALTAHEVRRSARRHAKRKGKAAEAELRNLRQRPRIAITVDFDLSSLTRHERRQLAERLRLMELEEAGEDEQSVRSDGAGAPIAPRRRKLRIPREYDPSSATSARHAEAKARRKANRESLGWTVSRVPVDDLELLLADERGDERRSREGKRSRRGGRWLGVEEAEAEMGYALQPEVDGEEEGEEG